MNPQQIARIVQNEINKLAKNVNEKMYYRGIVTAITGNKVNVKLEGNTYPLGNIICLDSYKPSLGDQVLVLSIGGTGANYVVLGKTDISYTPPEPEPEPVWTEIGRATATSASRNLIVNISRPCRYMQIIINIKAASGVTFWGAFNDDTTSTNYERNQYLLAAGGIGNYAEPAVAGIVVATTLGPGDTLSGTLEVNQKGTANQTIINQNITTGSQMRMGRFIWKSPNSIIKFTLDARTTDLVISAGSEVVILGKDPI